MAQTIAMILAGGQGSRLSILSEHRAKPAVPFGSNYRIIDFTLSNVMHSNIQYLGVLTQYKPYSLMTHISTGEAWGFSGRRSIAKVLPPYVGDKDSDWYLGTADAIYQNLSFINRFNVDTVLVLSGDHIYHMDYLELIRFHENNNADLTIATQEVPWEEAGRFGILKSDRHGRIELFQEKPKENPLSNQANLGIYVFKRDVLEQWLREDAVNPESSHDFGNDIIPKMVEQCRCFAWEFSGYWRDVGTLQSYWEANMECLEPRKGLDLANWHVNTNWVDMPTQFNMPTHVYGEGQTINSLVGKGAVIRGEVINSVLFRGVEVGEGAVVRDSILMDGVCVAPGAQVHHLIADKHSKVGANAVVGEPEEDTPANRERPHLLDTGLTLMGMFSQIPDNYRVGRNCLIYPDMGDDRWPEGGLPSGETLHNPDGTHSRRQ